MLSILRLSFGALLRSFRSRRSLLIENLVLRQQLAIVKAKHKRPKLRAFDKLFWVTIRKLWSGWEHSLLIVKPETVVRWHMAGFRLYWRWISRRSDPGGRKRISRELRALIFQMTRENPTWGAPRIHGELLKLGFVVSERTVLRWMRCAPRNPEPAQRWKSFLSNHREVIAAMDFFAVPTLSFGILYCFFVIGHDRRRVLHFNVTSQPTSSWVTQQLRNAFPYDSLPRYLIFDRDAKFSPEVATAVETLGSTPVRTSYRSPWQNGVAERWVGSCRRDVFDHVVVLNERHCKRLLREYVAYYHEDRTHLGLDKETPGKRPTAMQTPIVSITSAPRLGGLHHRYDLAA